MDLKVIDSRCQVSIISIFVQLRSTTFHECFHKIDIRMSLSYEILNNYAITTHLILHYSKIIAIRYIRYYQKISILQICGIYCTTKYNLPLVLTSHINPCC